jgi:serine-type D-Ala-D-Ala carboxypeptidase/endopeptidase
MFPRRSGITHGFLIALLWFAAANAAEPTAGVEGYWLGTLVAGPQKLRIQLTIEKRDDKLACSLDSLDQMAFGLRCANVVADGANFAFDIPDVSGRWVGKLSEDAKALSGSWTQGTSMPLSFERQAALQPPPERKPLSMLPAIAPVKARDMQRVLTEDFKDSIEKGDLAKDSGVAVTIGVIGEGERYVFTFGAGTPESVYEIGSITKTFTGLLLAQMIEQGRVKPTTPVRELLPANVVAKPNGAEITVLDLVTQRSGLPRMPTNFKPSSPLNPYVDYSAENMYAFISSQGVAKRADAEFVYSNFGFGLLGQALANRANQAYATLIEQQVLEPLCMNDTFVHPTPEQRARFAKPLLANRQPSSTWEFQSMVGAGGLRSTASDMLSYLASQIAPSNRCKKEAATAKTLPLALARAQNVQSDSVPGMKIAYAWMYVPQTQSYWHNGGTGGYASFAFFNPKSRTAAVVLTNLAIGPPRGSLADLIGQHIGQRFQGVAAVQIE